MQLESVRELKQELYEPLLAQAGLRPQEVLDISVPAERTRDVPTVQPGIALGISPGSREGDYKLAVRVQHRALLDGRKLAGIARAARDEVDIRYMGELTKQDGTAAGTAERPRHRRPLVPGTSIGHYAITAGTLGAFVRVAGDDRPRLLSNNHVFADENRGAIGDEILQPGAIDGGRSGEDRVASLERFVALDPARVNLIDGALAVLDDEIEFDRATDGVATSGQIAAVDQVERVLKRGRTTELTRGTVTAIEVDNVVVRFSTGVMRFDGQIEISGADGIGFSAGGDSGSLIVDEETGDALGLLFAGGDQGGPDGTGVTYANPLGTVFEKLGIAGLW